jgi:hypothetical protein
MLSGITGDSLKTGRKAISEKNQLSMKDTAENFKYFFDEKVDSIVKKMEIKINLQSCASTNYETKIPPRATLTEFREPSFAEVAQIIHHSPNKSSSADPLPTWLVKATKPTIQLHASWILNIAKASFSTNIFPTILKNAHVTPILKKHNLDGTRLENYRPINNLPFAAKVVERLVANRLDSYLEETCALDVKQSAYRRHHSTETALLSVVSDLASALDDGHSIIMIAMDVSAAFDTVQHSILLTRLSDCGIQEGAREWLSSYLSGRTNVVKYKGQQSSQTKVIHGVPQGSCLGPILFNLYMAPLGKLLTQSGTLHHIYADDVLIYFIHHDDSSIANYQKVLDDVTEWMNLNYLSINPGKTQALLVHNNRTKNFDLPQLSIMGEQLTICTTGSMIYLGVKIDCHLNLSSQVDMVCRGAFAKLKIIRRVRSSLKQSTALKLSNALVISRIDHCCTLIAGTNKKEKEKMQRVMNATARVVCKVNRTSSVTENLRNLKWLRIEARCRYRVACMVYKIMNGRAPAYLELIKYKPTRELRSMDGNSLVPAHSKKKSGKLMLKVVASAVWNGLPQLMREKKTFTSFKSAIFEHFINGTN